jgi:hypothetical protein
VSLANFKKAFLDNKDKMRLKYKIFIDMTNLFTLLGIRVAELKELIFVPEQTIYSWFNRQSTISPQYSSYISGLKNYHANQKAEDLETIYTKWEANNRTLLENQKSKALRELLVNEQKNNWALDQLKQKETRLLKRLHLSEHYPKYLSVYLQNNENLISWCSLISRKSAFELVDTRLAIQKLEEKKAGLTAQIQYLEGMLIDDF